MSIQSMPVTERYQLDFFAILVLIVSITILMFLIIVAVYFHGLMYMRPPSRGESTFLFWTSIIFAIIVLAVSIYALVHIFTHKAVVFEEPITHEAPKIVSIPQPVLRSQPMVRREYSEIPLTPQQRVGLNEELINLGESIGSA